MDLNVGRISGTGMSPQGRVSIALSGLHFHRTTIIALLNGPSEPVEIARTAEAEDDIKRGRRFQYDWPLAISSVWGKLYRGELMPERQADIELALIAELRNGDKEPSLSTVRPFAKPIFDEFSKP